MRVDRTASTAERDPRRLRLVPHHLSLIEATIRTQARGVKVQWLEVPDEMGSSEELCRDVSTISDLLTTDALHEPLAGPWIVQMPFGVVC